jgi:hypothetical protein
MNPKTNPIREKLKTLSITQLKETALALVKNLSREADLVFVLTLSELETRLPESEFVQFSDAVYAAA